MKRKLIAFMMAAAAIFSMTACSGQGTEQTEGNRVAMVTDAGDITDQSFNQATYEACKAFTSEHDVEFQYYKPDRDSAEARNASIDQAIADGYSIIVLPGYTFASSVVDEAAMYPEIKFIVLDCSAGDILSAAIPDYDYNPDHYDVSEYYNTDNVYMAIYQEELSGYMAGYAAVRLGYRHLGFLGGMAVPGVTRYGYGYVQGANEAAKELEITDEVVMEYVYGNQFYGDADITAYMDTWYSVKDVEVVFACGGGIYTSAAEAAAKVGAKVIGVDQDQKAVIDAYGEGMTVTSAMKGIAATINNVLDEIIYNDNWESYAGQIQNLGLVSENPEENYVQLPIESTQWSEGFTEMDYEQLVKDMYSGKIQVSNDTSAMPETEITVNSYGNIK